MECWMALKDQHKKDSLGNKVILMQHICKKNLLERDSMEQHISEFNEQFQKLAIFGENDLAENWRVEIVLSSLPKSFDSMTSAALEIN